MRMISMFGVALAGALLTSGCRQGGRGTGGDPATINDAGPVLREGAQQRTGGPGDHARSGGAMGGSASPDTGANGGKLPDSPGPTGVPIGGPTVVDGGMGGGAPDGGGGGIDAGVRPR